jgi:uncharacterized protein
VALDESGCTISDLSLHDAAAILLLNNGSAQETSFLDPPGLTKLLNMAFYVRGVDRGATAFLIALDDRAAYVNPNFSWFKEHLTSFVYIDRIVVSGISRGSGIGRMLYEDLFAAAKRSGPRHKPFILRWASRTSGRPRFTTARRSYATSKRS